MNFEQRLQALRNLREAEESGLVADTHSVRMDIVFRVHAGEITLKQGQAELKRILRTAKANGKITRNQVLNGYSVPKAAE